MKNRQWSIFQYVKEILVKRFGDYLKDNPDDQIYVQEWLHKIAAVERMEPSKQLSHLRDFVYEAYEGCGPGVRIVQSTVTPISS